MDLHATLNHAFSRCESVSSRQLQRAFRISRQSVWKRLKPLVDAGELRVEGIGRGVRYRPGPGSSWFTGSVRGGDATPTDFWVALAEQMRELAYVSVARAARGTRQAVHARALLEGLGFKGFVILDFAGVERVSPTFAAALVSSLQHFTPRWVLINASTEIDRALARAARLDGLRPKPD
jgi:hypothetical protein